MNRLPKSEKLPSHLALSAVALMLALGATACLGDAFEACPEDQRVILDPAQAEIWPPIVHTGYNGRDTFLAPVSTNYLVDTWASSNAGTVTVSPYLRCGTPSIYDPAALLTTQSTGMAEVIATAPGISQSVTVIVESYSTADTDIGQQRYNQDDPADPTYRRSCAGCHNAAGGIDHTPLEMAFHDDEAILSATRDSKYPDICTDAVGADCECGAVGCDNVSEGYLLLGGDHVWNLTPAEEAGIVAYMRALRPRGL